MIGKHNLPNDSDPPSQNAWRLKCKNHWESHEIPLLTQMADWNPKSHNRKTFLRLLTRAHA